MNVLLIITGYLIGSISAAILVCRALGEPDPRTVGSNNPGATNVLRQSGKGPALLTLIGDVAKGVLPVVLAKFLDAPPEIVALVGLAAFAGHLFPLFFNFKGGKGVATLIGVLFGFAPILGGAFIASWLIVAALTRYSSLAALSSAIILPLIAFKLEFPVAMVSVLGLMSVILLWRHQTNIRKLLNGTESKIGKKRTETPTSN